MRQEKILIVEDEEIVAEDLRRMLERLGYQVAGSVATSEEAIKIVEAAKPDLVLMDIHIRGSMDGIQVAEHICAHFDIPVIFLTAYANPTTVDRAKGTLPAGYILKPFEERDLKATMELALYRHNMGKMMESSDEWHGDILQSIDVALMAIDTTRNINYMNKTAEALTGRFLRTVFGKSIDDVLIAAAPAPGGVPSRFFINRNDQQISLDCKQAVIKDRAGNATGTVFLLNETDLRPIKIPALH